MTFGIEIMIIELIGIIAFAISGAIVGIKKRFDIFGIIVLGVITAVGGGAFKSTKEIWKKWPVDIYTEDARELVLRANEG